MLTVPLKTNVNDIVGVLQIINAKDSDGNIQPFSAEDEPFVQHFAGITSMIIQRARLTRTILLRMISMAELRDPRETGAHVNRVASYAVEIYERWAKLRNTPPQLIDKNRDTLRMAAMLHDVGKIAISDLILKKPAGFTKEEYETMKAIHFWALDCFGTGNPILTILRPLWRSRITKTGTAQAIRDMLTLKRGHHRKRRMRKGPSD